MSHEKLIQRLIQEGFLKTPGIINAFRGVRRANFMITEEKQLAYADWAMPIGYEQTISQPSVVALMMELLQPQPGEIILDIGSGSGWTTVLLSKIVGEKGKVIAVERIPALKEFGERNAARYKLGGIAEFICADASKGWAEKAPYDRILVSAEAKSLLQELREQLRIGGRVVIPIGSSIWLFVKKGEAEFREEEYRGYAFVPLIEGGR